MGIEGAQVEALYRQFGPAIYRRCLKLLGDSAEAEDATQEVFVRVFRNLRRYTYGDNPLRWIYPIATRHCLNRLRDGSRKERAVARSRTSPSLDPAGALADRELASRLLSRCDEKTGLIALYALVDGMTQEEVAQALGLSRKTVGVRLNRFLEEARTFLVSAA